MANLSQRHPWSKGDPCVRRAHLAANTILAVVARTQVLQARLEHPDEEVGDAVVEVAEGLVRVVAREHGLRVLRLLLAPGLGGLSRGGSKAVDAAPLAACRSCPRVRRGDVVLVLALIAGVVEETIEDLGEVLEAAEPWEAGEVGGDRARVDGVHPESGDVEALPLPFPLSFSLSSSPYLSLSSSLSLPQI